MARRKGDATAHTSHSRANLLQAGSTLASLTQARLTLYLVLLVAHLVTGSLFVTCQAPESDAAWSGMPLDDAWIHMVYARSLAESGTPCYNDGVLENGFTSPLWMIVGAVPQLAERFAGISAVTGIKVLGLLCGWLASCALAALVLEAGFSLIAALFAGLLLALSPPLTFAEVSGMEVALTLALVIGAFVAYLRGALWRAGFWGGLAVVARPEAILFWGALIGLGMIETLFTSASAITDHGDTRKKRKKAHKDPKKSPQKSSGKKSSSNQKKTGMTAISHSPAFSSILRTLPGLALPGLFFMGLWVLYSLHVSGRCLSNTFYAKFEEGGLFDASSFVTIVTQSAGALHPAVLIAAGLLTVAGLVAMVTSLRHKLLAVTLFGGAILFLLAVCTSREMPEGCLRFFYWWRYLLPALPFLWIPAIFGLAELVRFAGRGGLVPRLVAFAGGVAALVTLCGMALGLPAAAETYAWNCQNINEVQVELGRWVHANTPEGCVVAANDAGAMRFFGRRKTLDLMGLNWHAELDARDRDLAFPQLPLPLKMAWLHANGVHYLIVFPCWFPDVDVAARRGTAIPVGGGASRLQGRLEKVEERRSLKYTITKSPPPGRIGQDLMCVYRIAFEARR